MADFLIKVDEHTPMLFKALIKYSPYRQNYFAKELDLKPSNLSSYLNGKKVMPHKVRDGLLQLIGFNKDIPYIMITQDYNKIIRSKWYAN